VHNDQPDEHAGDITESDVNAEEILPAGDSVTQAAEPDGEGVTEETGEAAGLPDESPGQAPVAGESGQVDSAGDVVATGAGNTASPVSEELTEFGDGGPDSGPGVAASSPGPLRRLTRLGVTLILVASLLYVTRDAIPPAWTNRFIEMTGLGEFVSRFLPPRADTSGGFEELAPLPVPEAIGENTAERAVPADEIGEEEAGEGALPGEPLAAEPDLPATSAPTFFIYFTSGSDLLESDAWNALDRAALLLRGQSGRIGLITESSGGPGAEHLDSKLSEERIAAVEQYLVAAGVDRQRLRVNGRTSPESVQDPAKFGAEATGTDDRFVRITIGSRLPP
jgi:outer membrane protein OmpA-like peptidoglycan-associated protein